MCWIRSITANLGVVYFILICSFMTIIIIVILKIYWNLEWYTWYILQKRCKIQGLTKTTSRCWNEIKQASLIIWKAHVWNITLFKCLVRLLMVARIQVIQFSVTLPHRCLNLSDVSGLCSYRSSAFYWSRPANSVNLTRRSLVGSNRMILVTSPLWEIKIPSIVNAKCSSWRPLCGT